MSRASKLATEALHPMADTLDRLPLETVIQLLHQEDVRATSAVTQALPAVTRAARAAAQALGRGGRLLYVGAGTSGRLGALDAAECPPTFGTEPWQVQAVLAGGPKAMLRAVEGAEDDAPAGAKAMRSLRVGDKDFVCGISASGRTPFVLEALRAARRQGAHTALVCCNPPPPGVRPHVRVVLATGPELLAGSTRLKAGTATKMVLNLLSTSAMVRLGKVYRGRMVDLRPTNAKLKARAQRMVEELAELSTADAATLLTRAGGAPKLALAMHFTGLPPKQARAQAQHRGLRALERQRTARG